MSRTGFAKDVLQQFIARIERLNEEREALSADIREVFAEAKGSGFDCKIMRKVIAFRKLDKADFQEQEAMIDLYMGAVGFGTTPLAVAADYDDETGEISEEPPASSIDDGDLYSKAVSLVTTDRNASTSYVQRKLQLGYNRAASLIERMEREGIISTPNRGGKREVLTIPAGPQAGEHGQPVKTVEEASSAPAHDRSGQGPEGIIGVETPTPKADAVAGASAPVTAQAKNAPYPLHGFDIGEIPPSLDRRERAPPQPSA